MFYIIETPQQVNSFLDKGIKSAFVQIIPLNDNVHPILGDISLLYIKPYIGKGFIVTHTHSEALSLNITHINAILDSLNEVYVIDKKQFLHFFDIKEHKHIYDLKLIDKNIQSSNKVVDHFYKKQGNNLKINTIIPLTKHYERCEELFNSVKHLIGEKPNLLYNNFGVEVFKNIEKEGIEINSNFYSYFKLDNPSFSIKNDLIYTNYNLYTTTRRPSNSFNNVNFAALNKNSGCKRSFIPKNDVFYELDISSYHPSLIAQLINYDFKGENIHDHFAKLYGVSYDEAKELTFKQIYGNIFPKYKKLEYFVKVQEFIDEIWTVYLDEEKYTTLSGVEFKGDLTNNKLFNYIIQELETSLNIYFIREIQKILENKKSKLVLYTYDSFTIDLADEERYLVYEINELFIKKNLQTKIKEKTNLE